MNNRIRVRTLRGLPGSSVPIGSERNLPADVAEQMIAQGFVERVVPIGLVGQLGQNVQNVQNVKKAGPSQTKPAAPSQTQQTVPAQTPQPQPSETKKPKAPKEPKPVKEAPQS